MSDETVDRVTCQHGTLLAAWCPDCAHELTVRQPTDAEGQSAA